MSWEKEDTFEYEIVKKVYGKNRDGTAGKASRWVKSELQNCRCENVILHSNYTNITGNDISMSLTKHCRFY